VTGVATTHDPKRIMSPEQVEVMLRREEIVLAERAKGLSFYKIERLHVTRPHANSEGDSCPCGGLTNPDRIWRRAIQRDENVNWRRAEAIRLEEQRLDELQGGIWDKALNGDARAVEVALKVLERRARMLGLDFADYLSGQMVEVEQAKVRLMATALVKALQAVDASPEQRRAATETFFNELRASQSTDGTFQISQLSKEDEALL
jgi:hypothetical protein